MNRKLIVEQWPHGVANLSNVIGRQLSSTKVDTVTIAIIIFITIFCVRGNISENTANMKF